MSDLELYIYEYKKIIDSIWGTYLDANTGFREVKKMIENIQGYKLLDDISNLDSLKFTYGKGDPNLPGAIALHTCTQGEIKRRNSENGKNFKFIGNMTLISIYQYWEDYYREKIAKEKGVTKGDIKSDIMGDLRLIRISIIHHKGIALKEIEKCKILKWYKEGDEIFIDQEKLEFILIEIYKMLDFLVKIKKITL